MGCVRHVRHHLAPYVHVLCAIRCDAMRCDAYPPSDLWEATKALGANTAFPIAPLCIAPLHMFSLRRTPRVHSTEACGTRTKRTRHSGGRFVYPVHPPTPGAKMHAPASLGCGAHPASTATGARELQRTADGQCTVLRTFLALELSHIIGGEHPRAKGAEGGGEGSVRMAVHHRRRGVPPRRTPPPPDQTDHSAKKRNLPFGKSCRAIFGSHNIAPLFFQYIPGGGGCSFVGDPRPLKGRGNPRGTCSRLPKHHAPLPSHSVCAL